MRRLALGLCVILLAGVLALVWWLQRTPAPIRATPTAGLANEAASAPPIPKAQPFVPNAANSRAASRAADGVKTVADLETLAQSLHAPETSAREDLEILQTLLEFYRRANDGANPGGGLNEEIVEKLRGKNAKQLAVLPPHHPAIGADGQLRDRWGTPYFFHPISRTVLELRSAGPDQKLFTDDDVLMTPAPEPRP